MTGAVPRSTRRASSLRSTESRSRASRVGTARAGARWDPDCPPRRRARAGFTCCARCTITTDPRHRVVFHYTPRHSSWRNQIELWLSILVRKLLRRGSFTSVVDLEGKVLAFIAYYNRTMAKPFKWTAQGKALVA